MQVEKSKNPNSLSRRSRRLIQRLGHPVLTSVLALGAATSVGLYGVGVASASSVGHVKSQSSYRVSATWSPVGTTPHFTGVDYKLGRVFVSNLVGNLTGNLTVLNLQGKVLHTVKLGGQVHTVEVDQATGMVYVTDIARGILDVVNASTYAVTPIQVASHLHGLAVSNSLHIAVVTDVANSRVYLINTTTDEVMTPKGGILVGNNPWGVAIDHAHKLAYVASTGIDPFSKSKVNPAGDYVSVINLVTDSVSKPITVGPHPWNLAVTQSGAVYVGVQSAGEVAVIKDGRVVKDIPVRTSPHGVAYDPVRKVVLVNNSGSNNVSVISTETNSVVQTVDVGIQPQGIAIDPLTGDAYVANQGSNQGTNQGPPSVSVLSPT